MRRILGAAVAALLIVPSSGGWAAAQVLPVEAEPVDYVDPMIGTLFGGFSFPGPAAPYGMVQLSPDTEGEFAYTGYQYGDTSIRGFSHHHIQSMGVHSNGDLPFMPTVGPLRNDDPRSWMSPFDHATEEAEAGYYRVVLERYGIVAELTAGQRVGMHRYTFPASPQANVIIDAAHNANRWHPYGPGSVPAEVVQGEEPTTLLGTANTAQDYDIHFAAQFDRPFTFTKTNYGGVATFDTISDRDVLVKVGVSFVSRANALLNLESEKPDWDFDALRRKTRDQWNEILKTITVSGGTDGDKTSFYTALYHAQHHPNIYQDVNGEYMGHDNQVHTATDHVHYANFSLWDTYRGLNQLQATIQPLRYRDMMLSLLDIYKEGGRFPQWAMNDAYPDYMEGDPVQPTIVDGYCRSVLDKAYVDEMYAALRSQAWDEGARRSATESGYQEYHQRGFMSGRGADASGNFEYAIADFALALMADSLGKTADRDELLTRADNYRELINPASGFAHPRNADGSFMSGYDPMAPDWWKEGTGWQYTWLAPQDLRGLFDLVGANRGGDPYVIDRLDTYFSTAAADNPAVAEAQKTATVFGVTYVGNQHAPSNEHDVHAPYLYDYIGQPWKTQKIMRGYQALFRPTPDGLPGNDDLGSMSAWFVWSALGFYPVQGGVPLYSVGSPMFERAVITPAGSASSVAVKAPGATFLNKYIQSASLGQQLLDRAWFTHDELFDSGSVTFDMGPVENKSWAADPKGAPPSLSTHPLSAFGCPTQQQPEPEPVQTSLTYIGDTRARGEMVNLAARLTAQDGTPVAGTQVTFEIAEQILTAVTDGDGIARATATVPDHGREQAVIARFAGSPSHLPSETSATIRWGSSKG